MLLQSPYDCTAAGTYSGIVEKLGYLKRLGVNAIELLPVHEFNELEYYAVRACSSSFP
jgi:isoamylase